MGFGFGFAWSAALAAAGRALELVSNGSFASDLAGWVDASSAPGTAAWSAGTAVMTTVTGSRGRLRQQIATAAGKTYLLAVDRSGSGITLDIGTTAGGSDIAATVSLGLGANLLEFVATGAVTWLNFYRTSDGVGAIDNVSVVLK